jgi:O-antigen/teichoic acid export membrane protein
VRPSERPRATEVGRLAGRAGGALIDQVLSSGTQLLLIVLVARNADPTTLGAVSVALIVHGLMMGLVRAGVGEIVLLRCRADRSAVRREARRGLFVALLAGVLSALGLAAVGVVVGGEVGPFLLLMALAAPFVYTQDLLRYVAYGAGRVDQAVLVDGVWMVVQVGVSAALLVAGDATPTRLVLAWVLGAGVAAVTLGLYRHLWPQPVAVRRWWAEERARSSGFIADFLVSNGMWQGAFLLLGVFMSLEELGALRVAIVSVSPLANLMGGVRSLALANLAGLRNRPARALRRAAQVGACLAAAGTIYAIALVLLPDRWGAELFGETWAEAATFVGIVAVSEVFRLPMFAAIDLVKVLGAPLDLVRTRLTGSAGVVAGLLLGGIVAGPRGAAVGITIGYALNQVVWWRRARALSRQPAQRPPAQSV